jgi:hypothetical protein
MIVSSIAPQPMLVADELGIPSAVIANSAWFDVYHERFATTADVEVVREAHGRVHLALLFPMTGSSVPFRQAMSVPPVSRVARGERDEIGTALGVRPDEGLTFLSLRESVTVGRTIARWADQGLGFRVLVTAGEAVE